LRKRISRNTFMSIIGFNEKRTLEGGQKNAHIWCSLGGGMGSFLDRGKGGGPPIKVKGEKIGGQRLAQAGERHGGKMKILGEHLGRRQVSW